MTVYAKEFDPTTRLDKWKPKQVIGVFWDNCKGANVKKSGMETADSVVVFIPLANMIAIKVGDYIVKGLVEDEVTKITDLEKKYQDVHVVTKVDKKDFGSASMRHWEVGGA